MSSFKSTSNIGKLCIAISVFALSLLVLDAPAQAQSCECVDTYKTVSVRRAPVRRTARRYRGARSYRAVKARKVVRPVVETVYVPAREVAYAPCYVEYARDCDDDLYRTTSRVVVADRSYTNIGYTGRAVDADYYETRRIARDYGYKDGFYDGYQAGMERDAYHPENSGDYQKATNGYEDDFGDKHLYRQAYRNAYLQGYDSGWRSVAQSRTYRAARW